MATKKRATKKQSTRGRGAKKSAKKSTRKNPTRKKSTRKKSTRKAAKRTLIAPKGDKRYVRRGKQGRFKESDDVSSSLSSDRRKQAKRKAPRGQGDKGD
jgi:hypothetical protein